MTLAVNIAQSGSNNQTFRNRIINGAMMIDQRNAGASVNAIGSGVFPVDRFIVGRDTSAAVMPTQRSTTAPSGFVNSLQVTISTSATPASGDDNAIFHRIEGFNIADFGWGTASAQPITISFWVRASVTGTYGLSFANSAANRCYVTSYTVNSANTFEYKTVTIAGDTSGTWLTDNGIGLRINWDLGCGSARSGSATNAWGSTFVVGLTGGVKLIQNSGATFFITGVQLEEGTAASPFEFRQYGTELALCQRYFQTYSGGLFGVAYSSSAASFGQAFPVVMRAAPSSSLTAAATIDQLGVALRTQSSASVTNSGNAVTPEAFNVFMTNFSSMTLGYPVALLTTGGKLQFSAEL